MLCVLRVYGVLFLLDLDLVLFPLVCLINLFDLGILVFNGLGRFGICYLVTWRCVVYDGFCGWLWFGFSEVYFDVCCELYFDFDLLV